MSIKPPKVTPLGDIPPEVHKALMELVAFAYNQRSEVQNFDLRDLRSEGITLPNYRVTIEILRDIPKDV